jgi:hypothetical protein
VWERRPHESLERGGVSLEGGVWPSSEAESHPRGRSALERGWAAGADCSGGPLRPPGPWAPAAGSSRACFMVVWSFVFCYLRKKMGFLLVFKTRLFPTPSLPLNIQSAGFPRCRGEPYL